LDRVQAREPIASQQLTPVAFFPRHEVAHRVEGGGDGDGPIGYNFSHNGRTWGATPMKRLEASVV
jgi:hypothetical protein